MKDVNVRLIVNHKADEVKGYQYCEDGIEKTFGTAFKEVAKFIETINLAFKELNAPLDLMKDFAEYDELITKMDKDARELFKLEKEYQNEFNRVLEEAIEHKVDFKALYGGNNAATRKQYVEEQLSDMVDEIQELKFCKTENQRQLDFLKRLIDMKIQLIKYEGK